MQDKLRQKIRIQKINNMAYFIAELEINITDVVAILVWCPLVNRVE